MESKLVQSHHAQTSHDPPRTRARILDAALDVFSEHGFEGSSLQQIVDRLDLTKAALYYYFRSKDELLEALVEPAITGVTELLDACSDEPDTPAPTEGVHEAVPRLLPSAATADRVHLT